jgi:multicomponent Na+:H+ antiporter subunit E
VQVARLALDPRQRLEPAFVPWSPRLPPGRARDAFLAYASLLPGTLPAGDAPAGAVMLHAIAGADAAAATMTAEEARFARAFGLDA